MWVGLLTDRINNKLKKSNSINKHALIREPVLWNLERNEEEEGKSTISPLLFPISFAVSNLIGQFVGTLSMHSSPSSLASNSVICQIWTFIKWICASLVITECSPEKIGSLSKEVLERRTSCGSGPFPFLGSGFAQILEAWSHSEMAYGWLDHQSHYNGYFGIRDFSYLKAGIQDFKVKCGRYSPGIESLLGM